MRRFLPHKVSLHDLFFGWSNEIVGPVASPHLSPALRVSCVFLRQQTHVQRLSFFDESSRRASVR
jgi:hypothetical protein